VASQRLGAFLDPLQQALLHPDAQLQLQMQRAGIGRFATVQTSDYGGIYQIYIQTHDSEYAVIR